MYQRYKERFGTAGVIVGLIALVLALVTGAYAAGGGLTGKQKKEVTKIAKKYAGKDGTNGINGTNGAPGARGDKGDPGTNGVDGSDGTDGADGSPWTAGGVLPAEATETGAWGGTPTPVGGFDEETLEPTGEFELNAGAVFAPLSFQIPLAAELDGAHVKGIELGGVIPPECNDGEGAAPSAPNPEADPGYLCVFVGADTGETPAPPPLIFKAGGGPFGASRSGAIVFRSPLTPGINYYGTYAVTGA